MATFFSIVSAIVTTLFVKALASKHTRAAKVINGSFGLISLIGYVAVVGVMIVRANA
jgi:hypothetical protein